MKNKNQYPELDFEVLIDSPLLAVCDDKDINPLENKKILSLINDFENKKWRYAKFSNFIWDNIAETALSAKERESLTKKSHSSLTEAAKKLRLTDMEKDEKGKGSELAEIVLYGIMKHYYRALPVVPKIFYKQNVQDNAKGMDTVHIVIDTENNDFTLWFGEAKFYNSIDDVRLDSIVTSVNNSLETDKLRKENSIITGVSDLSVLVKDKNLRKKIEEALSNQTSIDFIKQKLHIPILLLHECQITCTQEELTDAYREQIKDYHLERAKAYFKKQIKKCSQIHKYSEIMFHIILFPVPKKSDVVSQFVKDVTHFKGK